MTELNDNTPVFCTAEIPTSLLNDCFQKANNAPEFAAEGVDDVGVLINTTDISTITSPTKPPQNLGGKTGIFNRALAVLDERTLRDGTCLLVTTWENPPREAQEGMLLKVRAEFGHALVVLNVKNLGIGGDEHFRGLARG
ncbi:hypothetical protein QBC34DRAFT_452330 [Podospora aff. communis PSN243]|uniref:Uncharacterized protein n=1 Tax=Podospora aff. communis PSN243 TaxID=3040156 RepID=A0AAV9G6R9_9PEZI|nr:hypothetical protein QBC34DRAFT_452330 [Podospora aff. communis PSN243]